MGNCQASEAATVVIQHPGGARVERLYWSLTASQVMAANPGHYVAVIISPPHNTSSHNHSMSSSCVSERAVATASPVKHLKLLRPDDTLHVGHVYRLVSFEEVLKEFASKKHVKLSRLVLAHSKGRVSGRGSKRRSRCSGDRPVEPETSSAAATGAEAEVQWIGSGGAATAGGVAARQGRQWRPALQSIEEVGGS